MRTRLVLLLAALGTLAACASEDPAPRPVASESHPACVPRGGGHPRICGLAPPLRREEDGSAYKATTVTGESFWVIVPDELAPASGVVAVPSAPINLRATLSTAPPRDAADRFCDHFPRCRPVVVRRSLVPAPLVRWDDGSGTIRDLEVTTLDLGDWTLVLSEPDADRAEWMARAIVSRTDVDGYPRLSSADSAVGRYADWASVVLWVPDPRREGQYHVMHVMPGCELSAKEPEDLGGSDAGPELEEHGPESPDGGTWCARGRYWVDVTYADRPTLELLHEKLRVVPG